MLQQLLDEIREGGTLEVNALARRLGASTEVVVTMIEHLQRLGLVGRYNECGAGCGGCGLQDSCSMRPAVRLWQSREK